MLMLNIFLNALGILLFSYKEAYDKTAFYLPAEWDSKHERFELTPTR